jgi:hypothetical protein
LADNEKNYNHDNMAVDDGDDDDGGGVVTRRVDHDNISWT